MMYVNFYENVAMRRDVEDALKGVGKLVERAARALSRQS